MRAMPFAETLFITDRRIELPGIRTIEIPAIRSHQEYSEFIIKNLADYISTSHALIIQWDGYITNPNSWSDEFLKYDYIGAPWEFHSDSFRVGNGGFSLRSKRLLKALQDPEIVEHHPEDVVICRKYRNLLESRYGITFATGEIARRFSFESTPPTSPLPFGFHGIWNAFYFSDFNDFLGQLSDKQVKSRAFRLLSENCIQTGRFYEATVVLNRRLEALPDDVEAVTWLKYAKHKLRPRPIQLLIRLIQLATGQLPGKKNRN